VSSANKLKTRMVLLPLLWFLLEVSNSPLDPGTADAISPVLTYIRAVVLPIRAAPNPVSRIGQTSLLRHRENVLGICRANLLEILGLSTPEEHGLFTP
jgi:hypothetical protein